jgi:hypothetical protein
VKGTAGECPRTLVTHTRGMGRLGCTIQITGELDQRFAVAFEGMTLTASGGMTTLAGSLADQSQFQGVLRQLFDLGMDVVSFTSTPLPAAVDDAG